LIGRPHADSLVARRDTQMSLLPNPPGPVGVKNRLSPSLDVAAPASRNGELTTGPRLTGADHSENFGAAEMDGTMRGTDSNMAAAMLVVRQARFMGPPFLVTSHE
jgi:hypothetical protein